MGLAQFAHLCWTPLFACHIERIVCFGVANTPDTALDLLIAESVAHWVSRSHARCILHYPIAETMLTAMLILSAQWVDGSTISVRHPHNIRARWKRIPPISLAPLFACEVAVVMAFSASGRVNNNCRKHQSL